jgi:hypothetical protein
MGKRRCHSQSTMDFELQSYFRSQRDVVSEARNFKSVVRLPSRSMRPTERAMRHCAKEPRGHLPRRYQRRTGPPNGPAASAGPVSLNARRWRVCASPSNPPRLSLRLGWPDQQACSRRTSPFRYNWSQKVVRSECADGNPPEDQIALFCLTSHHFQFG